MLYYEIRDHWGNEHYDAGHSDFMQKKKSQKKSSHHTLQRLLLLVPLQKCLVLHNSRFRACLA